MFSLHFAATGAGKKQTVSFLVALLIYLNPANY